MNRMDAERFAIENGLELDEVIGLFRGIQNEEDNDD